MVSYGLPDDSEEGDSLDHLNIPHQQQQQTSTRKRTYPVAFPALGEEGRPELYPYDTSIPVAVNKEIMPFGLSMASVLDCFSTALSWVGFLGLKVFATVGSWIQRHRSTTGHDGHPIPKRQRILSQESPLRTQNDFDESSPLISPHFSRQKSRSPARQSRIRTTPPRQQPQILPEPNYSESSFLTGLPYVDNQSPYVPSVPRSKRFPQPTRAQRFTKLASHLRKDSYPVQSSVPGGALRKSHTSRPGPYDRLPPKKRQQEAESRLSALERHAKQLQQEQASASSVPAYKWGDEEVVAEFRRHYRRPSQRTPPRVVPPSISREPKFDFKYSTPIPTRFEFGGQFTSPPRSGAPKEVVGTREPVSGLEKSQFTFELPSEKVRSSRPMWNPPSAGREPRGSTKQEAPRALGGMKTSQSMPAALSRHLPQIPGNKPQPKRPQPENPQLHPPETDNKNTFTILTQDTKEKSPFIRKTLPTKSHAMTFQIDQSKPPKQDLQQPHSFPPLNATTIPSPPPSTDVTPAPGHRRTKSVITPTRSSRRHRITATYAQDSHREFIRDLREILGQKKAKKDLEEKEIDDRIRKLREEEQAVESSLAGEIPRLPELLARKVHEALYDTPDEAVVVEKSFGRLLGRDIHRLQRGEWLNDEIINYYLLMVRERSFHPTEMVHAKKAKSKKELPRVHAFSTFFYSLLSSRGYSGVRRWTKKAKVNLFEMGRVMIPINKGGLHWVLCVVNVTEKRIEYYDSMGSEGVSGENRAVLENVRTFMIEEAKGQNYPVDEVAQWKFYVPKTPKQRNGWDCGVFTCMTAERLTSEVGRMNFGQDHMDRLREYMVAEVIDGVFYH